MRDIDKINKKIDELREELQLLISKATNLVDNDIIVASQNLDNALNEYNNLIKDH